MNAEELIRATLIKFCQEYFKTDYRIVLRQTGGINDNSGDGLKFFVAKFFSRVEYARSLNTQQLRCLNLIYEFLTYDKPLDIAYLQNYLNASV